MCMCMCMIRYTYMMMMMKGMHKYILVVSLLFFSQLRILLATFFEFILLFFVSSLFDLVFEYYVVLSLSYFYRTSLYLSNRNCSVNTIYSMYTYTPSFPLYFVVVIFAVVAVVIVVVVHYYIIPCSLSLSLPFTTNNFT